MSAEQTPGEILKAARELKGFQQADVAERLRLSLQTIIDIESSDFTHFSAEIYIKGHMKAYARLVNADMSELMQSYERMDIEVDTDPQIPVSIAKEVCATSRARRMKSKTLIWASMGVFLVLVIMVTLWWKEQQKPNASFTTQKISAVAPIKVKAAMPESEDTDVLSAARSIIDEPDETAALLSPSHKETTHHKATTSPKPDYKIEPVK